MTASHMSLRKDFVTQVTLLFVFPQQVFEEEEVRKAEPNPRVLGSLSSQR